MVRAQDLHAVRALAGLRLRTCMKCERLLACIFENGPVGHHMNPLCQ